LRWTVVILQDNGEILTFKVKHLFYQLSKLMGVISVWSTIGFDYIDNKKRYKIDDYTIIL